MLFRKVFDWCIHSVVWLTILITLSCLLLESSGVVAKSKDMTFDDEVVTSKVMVNDKSEKMIGSSTNIDRKSTRVKLFDDIFNVNMVFISSLQ